MLNTLPTKTPSEAKIVTWDFSRDTIATLSSPAITASVLIGSDPLAASLIITAPLVSGETVYALVSGGAENVTYELLCTVVDSTGQTHQSAASLTTSTAAVAL